jgi:hypothetical protein
VVPAEVMPVVPMSHLLSEAVLSVVTEAGWVLDMGTGIDSVSGSSLFVYLR